MTNPCCCSTSKPCNDDPCVPENFEPCSSEWPSQGLYDELANAFLTSVRINMSTVNFRLAVPWKRFGWGCWNTDETETCCNQFTCSNSCGNNSPSTMRVDCYSSIELSNFDDQQWRAQIFYPNQYATNCQSCPPPPASSGAFPYLTYGLTPINQNWPRCNDCSGITPAQCTYTQTAMPDFYIIDPDASLVYYAPSGGTIHQPASNETLCCSIVEFDDSCPSRKALSFTEFANNDFRLVVMPGSPTPCEPPAYRDVYMRKRLWLLPNLAQDAAGNCMRIILRVQFQHTFLPIEPDILYPPNPLPVCSCVELGRCYVLPDTFGCVSRLAQSEAWYYMDIYGTDTFSSVLGKPLLLFRVEHSNLEPPFYAAEEQTTTTNNFAGCECIVDACVPKQTTGVCASPITDFRTPPPNVSLVPCSKPTDPKFPEPPKNTHFTFPERLFISL